MSETTQKSVLNSFSFNYRDILIDEIALDGLEGIGLDQLWMRVENRISTSITAKMKLRFWDAIVNCNKLSFYNLPEPLELVEIVDRFTFVHEATGQIQEPNIYLDGPYEYCPVNNEYGSCKYYTTRTRVPREKLKPMLYDDVKLEYNNLVIVADIEERWKALAGHLPSTLLLSLNQVHYCILELVGKARENGQMTVGKTNMSKIVKDSKTLFYNRKNLQDLDLVRVLQITQVIGPKGVKSLLLRLKRFHKPSILSMAKTGILSKIVDHLLHKSDYSERTEVLVKKGILTPKLCKRLQKTVNIFSFNEKAVTTVEETNKTKKRAIRKKFISLSCKNDESSESDDEPEVTPLQCQYKVGVGLLRQAYERFLDAGLQGLTQVQLAQLVGVEFYTSRAICRVLKSNKIVREYLEDKGKQRTARYIAVVATENIDTKYATEKRKLLGYLGLPSDSDFHTKAIKQEIYPEASTSQEDVEVPRKKKKIEEVDHKQVGIEMAHESVITEIKVLDGCEGVKPLGSSRKAPTLRQLTFANGLLKVLSDRLCITGYQTLSNLASKEINEPPMDTKSLKMFIQKLVMEGYVKVFKVKWPGVPKCSVLICAHHVKCTDAVIKAKYKEICIRAATTKHLKVKSDIKEGGSIKPLIQFSYPRYLKIQKLHENIMRVAYFDYIFPESHTLSQGFVSVVDLIPEVTVEFVINNISNMGMTEISQLKITDAQLQSKLKDAPGPIFKILMRSSSLHNAVRMNLKVLAMLGLVQLICYPSSSDGTSTPKTTFLFYVNRRAKILDTTGNWPRTCDKGALERSYYFNTTDDVIKYWNDVFEISTSTIITLSPRPRNKLMPPLRFESEVEANDNGAVFGNGKGPCGFDSCFFMEIPRLWRTFYVRPVKTPHVKAKPSVKKGKSDAKKGKNAKSRAKGKQAIPVPEQLPRSKLQRKRTEGSIKWSKQEDMILTMCKAAITIMSPSSQPGSLMVRNMVAKDLVAIHDPKKTKSICHTRATALESNLTLIHEKQCLINELRRKRNIIGKYENLLKKLRLRYPANMTKFVSKARLPMFELLWIMTQIMSSKSYTQRTPCVALNLTDFHKNFNILTSTGSKQCNLYKAPENLVLKEAIMFTVMLSFESKITSKGAKKIYATFSNYPELNLRVAVEQLRKSGAISAKEKLLHNQVHRLDLEDIVQSAYKISAQYQRNAWGNRFNSEFVDNLAMILDEDDLPNEVKGSPEINCVFCEMQASDIIDISSATIPMIADTTGKMRIQDEMNSVNIETKFRLKSGTLTWKKNPAHNFKRFSQFYKHIDLEEVLKYQTRPLIIKTNKNHDRSLNTEDNIITHLRAKAEAGATFSELQEVLGCTDKSLKEIIADLESKDVVKTVGFNENKIVLSQYTEPWTIKFSNKNIITYPWLGIDLSIRQSIYLKWAGSLINKIFELPGSSIAYLSDRCEFLTCRSAQDICMFFQKCGCVKMKILNSQKVDLFSDPDEEPEFEEFNEYASPENIIVFPTKDAITRYAYLRKNILEKYGPLE